ncbi:MAG TPA: prepilin-type N-terminal cleavage/methylation domain-containing protein [Candidatus Saccharibacteria bacterium]|nr:prepilin-type N-terminal cleavage/methylation domain-containing protein [Candidatus Saccharibacteria bacterium]
MGKKRTGFTIVELLVVIVVISVLSIIIFVSYSGIRDRAIASLLVSNLNNVSKSLSLYQVENGTYPLDINELNNIIGSRLSSDITIQEYFPETNGFCVNVSNGEVSYRLTNDGEPRMGLCSRPNKDRFSLVKWNTWTISTGSVANYSVNGDGNSRMIDINPWGEQDVVWDISNQDVANDADGGWNGSSFVIDHTKMHRFSVFVRRKNVGNGSFYIGTHGYPDAVLNRNNNSANTNPYFCARNWWGGIDEWYLVIGHIWPSSSGVGTVMPESGIYRMNGEKLFSTSDFIWQPTTTSSHHRVYLYYSTDITTNQQMYQPRVDVVDGTEPTINELLNNSF